MVSRARQVILAAVAFPLFLPLFQPRVVAAQDFAPDATARGVTVLTRPRPEFDPVGVRVGGFRLDAAGELGAGYDSNLFGRSSDRVGDGFLETAAEAALRSDWTRHALGLTGTFASRSFADEAAQDWINWSAGAFGRYDIGEFGSLGARYAHRRQHLEVSSVDVQQAGVTEPVPYDVDEFEVTGATRFNRLRLNGAAAYQIYRYADVPSTQTSFGTNVYDDDTWIGLAGLG
jgi:hypothetical protein